MSDFKRLWLEIDERYVAAKDAEGALAALYKLYGSLDDDERSAANADLFVALRDGTEGERFDALAIINKFGIAEALPHMRELAVRLQLDDSPGAPFELEKVERFISELKSR